MKKKDDGKRLLFQYAGFATELAVSLAAAILGGRWLDKKIGTDVPMFTWLLPLLVLIVLLWKVIKDTSKK